MVFTGRNLSVQYFLPEHCRPLQWRRLGQGNIDLVEQVCNLFPMYVRTDSAWQLGIRRWPPCSGWHSLKWSIMCCRLAAQRAAHKARLLESQLPVEEPQSVGEETRSAGGQTVPSASDSDLVANQEDWFDGTWDCYHLCNMTFTVASEQTFLSATHCMSCLVRLASPPPPCHHHWISLVTTLATHIPRRHHCTSKPCQRHSTRSADTTKSMPPWAIITLLTILCHSVSDSHVNNPLTLVRRSENYRTRSPPLIHLVLSTPHDASTEVAPLHSVFPFATPSCTLGLPDACLLGPVLSDHFIYICVTSLSLFHVSHRYFMNIIYI